MSYQTLKAQLKTGQLSPCFHFFGEEQYLKNHYIGLLKKAIVDEAMETFNYIVFEGSVSAETLITALQTPPMMAEKKADYSERYGHFYARCHRKGTASGCV